MSIQSKILFFVIIQVLVITASLATVSMQIGSDLLKEQSRQKILIDFTEFVQANAKKISTGETKLLPSATKKILKNPDILYFIIQDIENNILSSKVMDQDVNFVLTKKSLKPSLEKKLKNTGFAINYFYSLKNNPVTEMIQELRWNGDFFGIVRLGIDESNFKKAIANLMKTALTRILYINACIIFLSFLITFIFARKLGKPIHLFQNKIKKAINNNEKASLEDIANKFELAIMDLNNSQKNKLEFVSTLSHEFSTPLQSIIGYTDYIRGGYAGEINKEVDDILLIIKQNSQKFEAFINDIRDLMNLETNKIVNLQIEKVEIKSLIKNLVSFLKSNAAQKDIDLILDIGEKSHKFVYCDAEKTRRVLINLISNAIKFSPIGGEPIVIKMEEQNDFFEISIIDQGIGVPEKELDNIFEKFFQIKQTQNGKELPNKGLGIGLSICKSIITAQKGRIWAESNYGEGTSIFFTLQKVLK